MIIDKTETVSERMVELIKLTKHKSKFKRVDAIEAIGNLAARNPCLISEAMEFLKVMQKHKNHDMSYAAGCAMQYIKDVESVVKVNYSKCNVAINIGNSISLAKNIYDLQQYYQDEFMYRLRGMEIEWFYKDTFAVIRRTKLLGRYFGG